MKIFLTTLLTVLFLLIGCSNEEEKTLKLVSLPESCEEIKYLYENKFRPKLILQEIILETNDDGIDVESWKYLNENAAHCKYKAFNKENNTEGNWKIIARRAMNTIGFIEIEEK